MSDQEKLEKLHERCKLLTSGELIIALFQMQVSDQIQGKETSPKLIHIFKTYLVRALVREGFR